MGTIANKGFACEKDSMPSPEIIGLLRRVLEAKSLQVRKPPHDPLEAYLAQGLSLRRVRYLTEEEIKSDEILRKVLPPLDFYLPDHNVFIEVKAAHTDRVAKQMTYHPNVIVIQGYTAMETFLALIRATGIKGDPLFTP